METSTPPRQKRQDGPGRPRRDPPAVRVTIHLSPPAASWLRQEGRQPSAAIEELIARARQPAGGGA